MTIETVANLAYYLISYDKNGEERTDDPSAPGGKLSDVVIETLQREPITDVFLSSHGWKGDIPAAIKQYDSWISAMARCTVDRERVCRICPEFQALVIGLHWPSLPWGAEAQSASGVSYDVPGDDLLEKLVEDAADKVADSERAKAALRVIFASAMEDISPSHLPQEVVNAYKLLKDEAGLESGGPAGAPGEDAAGFEPGPAYTAARSEAAMSFGDSGFGGLLSPLQQLSFWKMKKRARTFGEAGASRLLRRLQEGVSDNRIVRFHLMGHSFGCIVVSSMVADSDANVVMQKPIDSMYLVQGALSLWSYCSDIPVAAGKQGYFHAIQRERKVSGPILTTQSEHDSAVRNLYPLAAGLRGQVSYGPGELPSYGAVGTFGIRGPGLELVDLDMRSIAQSYDLESDKIYNIESSAFISEGSGLSGAHSDIAKPEVAHAFWAAVMASM